MPVIELMSKMNNSILELALTDAFFDLCVCEGEEVTNKVENYIKLFEEGTITEDQYNDLFEISGSFINNSVLIYGSYLKEGATEITVGADIANAENKATVAADTLSQTKTKSRKALADVKDFNLPKKQSGGKITEVEEIVETKLNSIFSKSAKAGTAKARTYLIKTSRKLADSTTSGIGAAKRRLKSHLTNVKLGGKVAIASPEKK